MLKYIYCVCALALFTASSGFAQIGNAQDNPSDQIAPAPKKKSTKPKVVAPIADDSDEPTTPAPRHRKGVVDEMSGQGYGMAGCGLGSILFGEHPGMVQIFAVTTNNIAANQTFAMTSGTSNCAPEDNSGMAAEYFIEGNRQALENDIARGRGETLSTLSGLIGCKNSQSVGQRLQRDYRQIFSEDQLPSEQLLQNIKNSLRSDKGTAQTCSQLG
jgi:hypothetical protein